jgi:hypothetical protein
MDFRFSRIDSHCVFLIVSRSPSMLNFVVGTSVSRTMLWTLSLVSLSIVITMSEPWWISMDRTCSSFEISKKGAVLDFYRRRTYLSYADTENDHFVNSFRNVYSVPYDGSSLLLNIGALFGSGELNNRRYGIMLFNLYRVSSFCSSCRNLIFSGVCAILPL